MCWNSAPAGTTAYQKCPISAYAALNYVPEYCAIEYGVKVCQPNGSWSLAFSGNEAFEQTDYKMCSTPGVTDRLIQKHVSCAMFIISMIVTIIGIIIFVIYKQYRFIRVQIHLNFFASLIMTCIFNLLFAYLVEIKHYHFESQIDKK